MLNYVRVLISSLPHGFTFTQMNNHHPPASPLRSEECSPFKDLTITPNHGDANALGENLREQLNWGQNWDAQVSDEKIMEYNRKRPTTLSIAQSNVS